MNKTEKYNIQSIDIHGHGCDVTELKHVLPPEEFAIETASLFHREVCVRNIAEAIEMSPPAVSHHLRSLKQLGVITSRRIGKEVHYTIADTADGALVSDLLKTVFERKGMYEEDI